MAANDWLHDQLQAQQATDTPVSAATRREWHAALSTLQGRLPALAAHLDRTIATAAAQRQVCVPQAELDLTTTRHGIFRAKARWRQATPTDDAVQAVRRELAAAAQIPSERDEALRRALGNPVAITRSAFPQPATPGQEVATSAPTPAPSPTGPAPAGPVTRASSPRAKP